VADSCKHGNEPVGSIKSVGSLLRVRPLLTSHAGGGDSEQRSWISITPGEGGGACSVHG